MDFDLIFTGGLVVDEQSAGPADLGIRGGRIAAVAEPGALDSAEAAQRINCSGLHILPGVIDAHH